MEPTPTLELVGDWTSARLLIRLLQAIDSPWQLSAAGLTHVDTGETCTVSMRAHDPRLTDTFARGECPVRPSLNAEALAGIESHRAVVTVRAIDELTGWDAARAVVRCANGLIDGGAIALRCVESGLAHSGDHWQTLERMAEAAEHEGNRVLLGETLYMALVMPMAPYGDRLRTRGMALLEAPDAMIPATVPEANALDALEATCLRVLAGQAPATGDPIRASPSSPAFTAEQGPDPSGANPFGIWALSPQPGSRTSTTNGR
jgi:hypothetical protein